VTILEVDTVEGDGLVRLRLKGELDLSTVSKVDEELKRAESGTPALIVLDLSELTFLDSTGLRLVIRADQRARDEDRRLAVVKGPESVQRVFSITRVDERLEMVDDVAQLA
jgi:anti-anti-sigma factor